MLDNANSTINYRGFETIDIWLSGGQNRFTVVSTAVDSSTYIQAQYQNDTIIVQETQGYLQLHGGGETTKFPYTVSVKEQKLLYTEMVEMIFSSSMEGAILTIQTPPIL